MKLSLSLNKKPYIINLNQGQSIAITLVPNGEQPSHFGAPACSSETLEGGGFVGDTKRGGSCNVNALTIIPHCNGTHTESIAHIVDQEVPVHTAVTKSMFVATIISVLPTFASSTQETYLPNMDTDNQVITRSQLEQLLLDKTNAELEGLIIRTRPNSPSKCSQIYDQSCYPVYLTNNAMSYLVEREVSHLLVDFPSVDKMYDEGILSNHRIFWNVSLGENAINENSWREKTITEMIYVNDLINDGLYLCDLQIPAISTDAVPSRPIVYPLNLIDSRDDE